MMVESRLCEKNAKPNQEMRGLTRIYYSMVFNLLDATIEANRIFCFRSSIKVEGLTSLPV